VQARLPSFSALVALGGIVGKLRLDGIPELRIDDRLMFADIRLFLMDDLAAVDAVLQHLDFCAQPAAAAANGLIVIFF
jgi:hypothetical protein